MATIESYVVHSRTNGVSPRMRRRALLWTVAGVGLVVAAGVVFAGQMGTPWRAKFEARVAADSAPYPLNQEDDATAAFQQSVAISHLTTLVPAPVEAVRPVAAVAKAPRAQKASPVVKKSLLAPVPPPRPAGAEISVLARAAPPVVVAPARPPQKTPVLIEIVHRLQHAPDRVVDFASGVTAKVLSLRTKVGL